MSDPNPYQSPGECDESSMPPTEGWPKTATVMVEVDDYVRAHHMHYRQTRWWIRIASGAFAACLLIAALRLIRGQDVLLAIPVVMVVIFLLVLATSTGAREKQAILKSLREMGKQQEEVRYKITPEQLCISTEESDTRIAWDRFLKWKERKHLILLYRSSTYFLLVPIDKFEPDVADAIRACLRANVPA